ncbi:50S ribosomal protein L5 [Candidatus Micrarchaeota archaeon]|nr:50S ribosomal protein L5 [Candidatus Micrarchaeota archaeon]
MNIKLEKVTLNIGVGEGGQALENARQLLENVSGGKPIVTKAKARIPSFKLKKGDPVGVKVTIRGAKSREIITKGLQANENKLSSKSFDDYGNCAFGVKEYIDYPGIKYDPKIGMIGFDICITLKKPGSRIAKRKIASRKLPKKQRVSRVEAQDFMKKEFGVELV